MFNSTFAKQGLDCTYLAFEISPDHLPAAVEAARSLGFAGFNVTMPHKVAILRLLDKVSSEVADIGSANTVVRNAAGFEGYNTDGEGAVRALRVYGFEPKGSKVLLIGAGGAARSIVHRLSSEAEEISILNRSEEGARRIADKTMGLVKTRAGPLSRKELETGIQKAGLIVNATPIHITNLLETFRLSIPTHSTSPWIFDLAYNSEPKQLLPPRRIHPLELLVQQAALSYELWFGESAPVELMRSILVQHNGADWK